MNSNNINNININDLIMPVLKDMVGDYARIIKRLIVVIAILGISNIILIINLIS